MKIRLSIGREKRQDYVCIDPYTGDHKQDIKNFDNVCLDSQCTGLLIEDLQRFSIDEVGEVMTYYQKKLRLGAKIKIICPCLDELTRLYSLGEINEVQLNSILFGPIQNIRRGCYTLDSLILMLQQLGLTVTHKSYNTFNMIIEAQRCT